MSLNLLAILRGQGNINKIMAFPQASKCTLDIVFKVVPLHNVQFVKYDVTVSFMAQVLDTVTYLVPQVLDTAS